MNPHNPKTKKKRNLRGAWDVVVVLSIILLIGVFWLVMSVISSRTQMVEAKEDIIEAQLKQENALRSVSGSPESPKVVLNPYGISPLSAVIMFKTEQPEAPELTVVGKDDLTTFTHTFEKNTEHRLPVYGLYADSENTVKLKVGDAIEEVKIKTDPLPDGFPEVVDVKAEKDQLTNDLYFMTNSSTDSKTLAYDVNGDVRWFLTEKYGWEITRSKQTGRIFVGTDRLHKGPYYRTGFYEIDLLGKIHTEYTIPGGYHHDLYEKQNGNILVATDSTEEDRNTVEDVVVEIDRKSGDVIKTIDFAKIWQMDTGKSVSWTEDDWFHNNSVWLDEKSGELLLSGRHQDAVVVLDYETDEIKYIIGSPEGWSGEMQKHLLTPKGDNFEWQWQQHAAKKLPNGDILVFDNGNNKSKKLETAVDPKDTYSRAVIYRVNEADMTIEQIWQYGKERGHKYFSPYISEADYLGEDHYLVHSGGVNSKDGVPTNMPAALSDPDTLRSYTTEVKNDKVIFELVNNQNQYRAEKMSVYSSADTSLKLGKAQRLGSQAASHTCGDIPIERAKRADREYRSHDIAFEQEFDRLVMKGNFDKEDIVRLSLVDEDKQYTYKMPVDSETESKAMCIDIFDYDHEKSGDMKDVENYVNTKGLSGEYKIYLSIQDRVYDTGKKVEF